MRYGLQKKHADRMSFHNLSTFIGACQFQAASLATQAAHATTQSVAARKQLASAARI